MPDKKISLYQSEAVLLKFGDLVLFRCDQIVDRWPVLPVGVSMAEG